MKIEDERVYAALSACESATTWPEYRAAKRLAARCGRIAQWAMVDSLKAARARVLQTEAGISITGVTA